MTVSQMTVAAATTAPVSISAVAPAARSCWIGWLVGEVVAVTVVGVVLDAAENNFCTKV